MISPKQTTFVGLPYSWRKRLGVVEKGTMEAYIPYMECLEVEYASLFMFILSPRLTSP